MSLERERNKRTCRVRLITAECNRTNDRYHKALVALCSVMKAKEEKWKKRSNALVKIRELFDQECKGTVLTHLSKLDNLRAKDPSSANASCVEEHKLQLFSWHPDMVVHSREELKSARNVVLNFNVILKWFICWDPKVAVVYNETVHCCPPPITQNEKGCMRSSNLPSEDRFVSIIKRTERLVEATLRIVKSKIVKSIS